MHGWITDTAKRPIDNSALTRNGCQAPRHIWTLSVSHVSDCNGFATHDGIRAHMCAQHNKFPPMHHTVLSIEDFNALYRMTRRSVAITRLMIARSRPKPEDEYLYLTLCIDAVADVKRLRDALTAPHTDASTINALIRDVSRNISYLANACHLMMDPNR